MSSPTTAYRLPHSIARLVRDGVLDGEAARAALARPGASTSPVRAIVAAGLAAEEDVAAALAVASRRPRAALTDLVPDPTLMRLFSPQTIQERQVLPVRFVEDGVVEVAMIDPLDHAAAEVAVFLLGPKTTVRVVVARPSEFDAALARIVVPPPAERDTVAECVAAIDEESVMEELADPSRPAVTPPTIRLVDELIEEAVRVGASDIHVEPEADELIVRNRIDGVLHERHRLKGFLRYPVASRLKIMAGMDVAEHRRPQDGQFAVTSRGRRITSRVSSIPSIHGENITMRLLDPEASFLGLDQMGLPAEVRAALQRAAQSPQGIIISTGPTGSGKTSTQYALLRLPLASGRKTITLENPVEYRLKGATQIDINERAGMTFAAGLRAVLRQDPNVILVGEVRDRETAEIACRAALTGHLVLTTLHTNDAVGTIVRLNDIGIDPATLASSLSLIVAQRLVRTLCTACSVPDQPAPERLAAMGLPADGSYRRATGCATCTGTGYRGRVGVFEVLEVTPPVRALISKRASEDELRRALVRMGVRTLHASGSALARQGVTSLDELARVLSHTARPSALCPSCAAEVYVDFESCPMCLAPLHAPARADDAPAPSRSNRVLVADDDEGILELVCGYVRSLGYEPLRVSDGPTAIRLAREELPAAIVLDVFMPRLTGIQACERLRADPLTAAIPVIIMTADEGQELKLRAYDMGTDDFVRKPIDPADFMARLRRVLARREKVDALTRRLDPAKVLA